MNLRLLVFASLLLQSGCSPRIGVEAVEIPGQRIAIKTSASFSFEPPCVHGLRIYRRLSEAEMRQRDTLENRPRVQVDHDEVWSIELKEPARCIGAFTYPDVPVGYGEIDSPAAAQLVTGAEVDIEADSASGGGSDHIVLEHWGEPRSGADRRAP